MDTLVPSFVKRTQRATLFFSLCKYRVGKRNPEPGDEILLDYLSASSPEE